MTRLVSLLSAGAMVAVACTSAPPTTTGIPDPASAGSAFIAPFEIEMVDQAITTLNTLGNGWITFQRGPQEFLLFTTAGPTSSADWRQLLTLNVGPTLTEGTSEIGGIPASVFDMEYAGEPLTIASYHALDRSGSWEVTADADQRIWVLDVEDDTIAIMAEAPEDLFEDWIAVVETSLTSLTWMPA